MDDGSIQSSVAGNTILIYAVIILLLVYAASQFAIMETAFSSVSPTRLRVRKEKGDRRAEKALNILDNFDSAVTTILICTNIIHLSAAALMTTLVTKVWGIVYVAIGSVFITIIIFFAGEMLPKTIAKNASEQFCLQTAGTLQFFMRLFTPLATLLSSIGNLAARLTKGDEEVSVTEDELYDLIEDMTESGNLDEDQGDLVQSALEFANVTAENILTAHVDIAAIDVNMDVQKIAEFIRTQRHSRLPVYEGSLDKIIGVLQIRKFIKAWLKDGNKVDIRSLLDDIYFVAANTKIDDLLPEMSRRRVNMAVVTDAWGGTLGIVTVEDILEELVGEIWDEEDEVVEYFIPLGGNRYELDAKLSTGEAFDLLEFDDPENNEEIIHLPIAVWAISKFNFVPKQKDCFDYYGLHFELSSVSNHRIRKLVVTKSPEGGEQS